MKSRKWVIRLTVPIVTADGETVDQISLRMPNVYDRVFSNDALDRLSPFQRIIAISHELADVGPEIMNRVCIPDFEQLVEAITEISAVADKMFSRRNLKKLKKQGKL